MQSADTIQSVAPGLLVPRLEKHFRITFLAIVSLGYLMLYISQLYPLWTLPIAVGTIGYSVKHFQREESLLFDQKTWTILTLLLVVGAVVGVLGKWLDIALTIGAVFFILPLIKLMMVKRDRDYFQLYALAFAQILFSTILTLKLSFGVVFVLYLWLMMWGLILFTFRKSVALYGHQPGFSERVEKAVFRKNYIVFIVGLGLLAVLLTIVIFWVIPRPHRTYMQLGFGIDNQRTTGFAENISLGQMGDIQQNNAPAMRVRVSGKLPPPPYYWKGVVFEQFDGKTWREAKLIRTRIDGRKYFQLAREMPSVDEIFKQEFLLDKADSRYVFHDLTPVAIEGHLGHIYVSASGVYVTARKRWNEHQYIVYSAPLEYGLETEKSIGLSGELPEGLDPRIGELARSLTKDIELPLQKAIALSEHLSHNYEYRMGGGGVVSGGSPLADFLFVTKAGHCEYFASAMAVMLRTLEIPSRVVGGYNQGEYNQIEDYYLVRQSDAHAWVEARIFDPNMGAFRWVRFDPTPSGGSSGEDTLGGFISQYIDALRYRWQRYIIEYSVRDQMAVAMSAAMAWERYQRQGKVPEGVKDAATWTGMLVAAIVGILLLIRVVAFLRVRKRRGVREIERDRLRSIWNRLTRRFAKLGLEWPASEPPRSYLERAARRFPGEARLIEGFSKHFNKIRYEPRPTGGGSELEALEDRLNVLLTRLPKREGSR